MLQFSSIGCQHAWTRESEDNSVERTPRHKACCSWNIVDQSLALRRPRHDGHGNAGPDVHEVV